MKTTSPHAPDPGNPESDPTEDVRVWLRQNPGVAVTQLVDALQRDQLARWRRGERVPAEAYLQLLTDAATSEESDEQALDLIYAEYLLRREVGERPALGEYRWRFPQHAERIGQVFNLEAQLGSTNPTGATGVTRRDTPRAAPADGSSADGVPTIDGYELLREVGRGGMGIVYAARDLTLDREVAVKTVLPHLAGIDQLAAEFEREVRITARLPHPGVPPVHAIGTLSDGRPFLVMKLIRGRTLAAILAEGTRARPELIAIFEQICQAVGFAHSHGVIHRDLKPGNIMVGALGEVQVMDWGLAKEMRNAERGMRNESQEPAHSSIPHSEFRTPNFDATAMGQVKGTPAFMPPEQARGEWDIVDTRSDVFALGGLLCTILTGKAPYIASQGKPVLVQATEGNLAPAFSRLDGCGADAELIALAKQCLAAEPDERPPDAAAVATAVTAYLGSVQERLRRAEVERAEAQVKAREERRRRRVLVAFFLALLLLGGLSAGVWWRWTAREKSAAQNAEVALREVEEHEKAGRWREAITSANRALAELGETDNAAIRSRVRQATEDAQLVIDLDTARLLGGRANQTSRKAGETDLGFADTFRKHNLDPETTPPAEFAAKFAGRPRVAEQVAAALDVWAQLRRGGSDGPPSWAQLVAVAQALDPDPWRTRLRVALDDTDPDSLRQIGKTAPVEELPPGTVVLLADGITDRGHRDVVRFNRTLAPLRWLWVITEHGAIRAGISTPDVMRVASLLRVVAVMADVLEAKNGDDRTDLHQGIALLRRSLLRHPGDYWVNTQLGMYSIALNPPNWQQAAGYFRAAYAIRPAQRSNLAQALLSSRATDEALELYQLILREDSLTNWERASIHSNIAAVAMARGDHQKAIPSLQAALAAEPNLAIAHHNLGITFYRLKRFDAALQSCLKARELAPSNSKLLFLLGQVFRELGRHDEAIAALRECTALPTTQFPEAFFDLAMLLLNVKQDGVGAREAFELALRFPSNDPVLNYDIGTGLGKLKAWEPAIVAFRRSLQLNPRDAATHYALANTLKQVGKIDDAVTAYRAALAIEPNFAEVHCDLGLTLRRQGKFAEAWESLKRGHALGSARPDWRAPSEKWLRETEPLGRAERDLPRVLRGDLKPEAFAEWLLLMDVCFQTQRYSTGAHITELAMTAGVAGTDRLSTDFRYNGARMAVLAGLGGGSELDLDAAARARRRALGLRWLRDDLTAWTARLNEPMIVQNAMLGWQNDPALVRVRAETHLANLPAEEQENWRKLWADVEALRKTAAGKK